MSKEFSDRNAEGFSLNDFAKPPMSATPKPRAGEHVTVPQFGVDWKDQSVTLFTRDGFILARSNDSAKGKIYESIVVMEAERDLLRERERELAEALETAFVALGWAGANGDVKHAQRAAWEKARAVLAKVRP